MTDTPDNAPPIPKLLRDAIVASKWGSVRKFAPAFAEAQAISEKSALRSLRKYTSAEKPTTPSESTALVLANLLGTPQNRFVSPSAAQRASRDAQSIAALEERVGNLEVGLKAARGQIREALALLQERPPGRRGGRGGTS